MTPRFKPKQEVWIILDNKPMIMDVSCVVWYEDSVTYELMGMNFVGHQYCPEYEDTEETKAEIFETKKECEQWINQ